MKPPPSPPLSPPTVDPEGETLDSGSAPSGPSTPVAEPDPLVGRSLRHFRVDALLGRGGMGAVYCAWDTSLERPVALKVLHRDSEETRARFMREARTQAKIRHPNVVPIHFVGEDDGIAFLVMDLIEGESLEDLLRRDGKLDVQRALDVADAVATALGVGTEYGLVHRDVKPSNILIDSRGHVLLADFGLAKQVAVSDGPATSAVEGTGPGSGSGSGSIPGPGSGDSGPVLTHDGSVVGTPLYVSPEQTTGGAVDHRSDVYALGVTLYQALAGRPPFSAPSVPALLERHRSEPPMPPRELSPALPAPVEELVLRMLAKRPEDRFATYEELRAAILAARPRARLASSPFARAAAFAIDVAVLAIPAALAALLSSVLSWPVMALGVGLAEGRWGKTLGKRLLLLAVVRTNGDPVGYRRALARAFLKLWGPIVMDALKTFVPSTGWWQLPGVLVFLAWAFGWLLVLFGRKRSLHDRIAGTDVLYAIGAPSPSRPPK